MAKLAAMPAGADHGPLRPRLPERLRTPERRIGLLPAIVADALPDVLEAVSAGRASPTGRLLLIGRRHQRDNNSWLHNARA